VVSRETGIAAVATAAGYAAFPYLGQFSPPHLQAFGAGVLLIKAATH